MKRPAASDYLPTLDGWRAIAILGVLICHASTAVVGAGGTHPNSQFYALTRYGALGVDIFFGISGFLICTRLLEEEQTRGRISLKNFYIRRGFRILPPYLLYLVVLALIWALGLLALHPRDLLSCVFFFRNYIAASWYTGHFWSLAVEEHFYVLWPCLLFFTGSRRGRLLVVVLAMAVGVWRSVEFRHGYISQYLPGASFYERTDVRIDALLWGCWAALLFQLPVWRERLSRWISLPVWLALAGAFVSCVVLRPPFSMMFQALIIPLLLVGTIVHPAWWLGRLLESTLLRWIGRISYGLYLWQQLFTASGADSFSGRLLYLQRFPFNIAAIFTCACLSYYLMERRMIRTGHALTPLRPVTVTLPEPELPASSPANSQGA